MKKDRGFTLIETLVYLALFGILFSGVIVCAYSVLESSARNQTKAMAQAEGDFLVAKINWTIKNAKEVISPVDAVPNQTLTVRKFDNSYSTVKPSGLDCAIVPCDMLLLEGTDASVLNNSDVKISQMSFIHFNDMSGKLNQESVQADFTLRANTADGKVFSQTFSTTVYLRK